jgi:nucleoside-diphosphate-sugar epimerase
MSRLGRILVTGAFGFVGRAVVAGLASGGHGVRAAVRRSPQFSFAPNVDVTAHADLKQAFDWQPLLEGVDQVVHLAGIAHAGCGVTPETAPAAKG